MTRYKPGDTFTTKEGRYEFVAHNDNDNDNDNDNGCERCMGNLHTGICDWLPSGCGEDQIIWKASNDTAKLLHVILKLEGTI